MKNKKLIIILIAGLAIMMGCEVLNLDEKPKNFIAPESFFNSPGQIESILAACGTRTASSWGGYFYIPDVFRHDDQNNGGDLIITLNFASAVYNLHYANLKDLNPSIAAINEGKLKGSSTTVVDQLMGQLKFLRAWNYFQLVRMWGPVPLVTDKTEAYFNYLPSRAPIVDVYELIISDFTEAIEKLPVKWASSLVGRPSRDAAKGLLAKVYLTMATSPLNDKSYYPKAAALAKEVMDAGNYSLVVDINNVFSMATKYGPEMMWSFNANTANPSTDPRIWSDIYGWGDYSADRFWVDSIYPQQPRKDVYIETKNREGIPFATLGNEAGIKKFMYDTWDNFARAVTTINIPIIRYADVLLIFAEAKNMANGGPTQEAVDAINKTIDRANGYVANPKYPKLTTSMSMDKFDEAVIEERSLELCFEYDRWFDLIRKRILLEKSIIEIKPNFSEHIYLFPIPETEIRLNPNMEQNTGY